MCLFPNKKTRASNGRKVVFWMVGMALTAGAAAYSSTKGGAYLTKKSYSAFDENEFMRYRLESSQDVSPTTKKLTFQLHSPFAQTGVFPSSYLLTRFKAPATNQPVVRPYTPITSPRHRGSFEILVKRYPDGKMSSHLHALPVGAYIEARGPVMKRQLRPNCKQEMAFVAAGTGITPMYQVIRETLQNATDFTLMTLIYSCRNENEILLKQELEQLAIKHPHRFRIHYVITRPQNPHEAWKACVSPLQEASAKMGPEEVPKLTASVGTRINAGILRQYLPAISENILIWVCGPPGFMKAVSGTRDENGKQGELSGLLDQLHYHKTLVYKL
eukprot:Sdes_comp9325_c0_seq1m811